MVVAWITQAGPSSMVMVATLSLAWATLAAASRHAALIFKQVGIGFMCRPALLFGSYFHTQSV